VNCEAERNGDSLKEDGQVVHSYIYYVVGTAALVLTTAAGSYDLDGDGWEPGEVRAKLKDTAEVLVGLSLDEQGAGLVRADLAIQ